MDDLMRQALVLMEDMDPRLGHLQKMVYAFALLEIEEERNQ